MADCIYLLDSRAAVTLQHLLFMLLARLLILCAGFCSGVSVRVFRFLVVDSKRPVRLTHISLRPHAGSSACGMSLLRPGAAARNIRTTTSRRWCCSHATQDPGECRRSLPLRRLGDHGEKAAVMFGISPALLSSDVTVVKVVTWAAGTPTMSRTEYSTVQYYVLRHCSTTGWRQFERVTSIVHKLRALLVCLLFIVQRSWSVFTQEDARGLLFVLFVMCTFVWRREAYISFHLICNR